MELTNMLKGAELFDGLSKSELEEIASICTEKRLHAGEYLIKEGDSGAEMYIITDGFVEILLGENPPTPARVVVNLGPGQITGEMTLLDLGPRSASVRALSEPTILQAIHRDDLNVLCQKNTHIGYIVMRNLALDLSFKLRHRNFVDR